MWGRFAGETYAELAEGEPEVAGVDLLELSRQRFVLADELEPFTANLHVPVPLADALEDWREGSSALDLMSVIERELACLAELAYLANAAEPMKTALERVDEAVWAVATALAHRTADLGSDIAAEAPEGVRRGEADGAFTFQPDDAAGFVARHVDLFVTWFGTNRALLDPTNPSRGFSGGRAEAVTHGRCLVRVPESHQIGSMGSGLIQRLVHGDDRLKVHARELVSTDRFWSLVDDAASCEERARQAVVFIHGYRVSFDEAALRTAQLGVDLGVNGPMAFFSWPSKGRLLGYFADGDSIAASAGHITDFLVSIATLPNIDAVHVIAHSMGNRGTLAAVTAMAAEAGRLCGRRFGQFLLAAADVDVDVFRRDAGAYGRVGSGTTLYVSPRDKALQLSSRISNYPRVGRIPPVGVFDGIDTIDVGDVDLDRLGHGYVGDHGRVLEDMHRVLGSGDRPNTRFGLERRRSEEGADYWGLKR